MNQERNGKEYIRKLLTLVYLSIAGPLLFFVWVYLEVSAGLLEPKIPANYHLPAFLLAVGLMIVVGVLGYIKIRALTREASKQETLYAKLTLYKKAVSWQFMIYSVAAGLVAIGLYLTGYQPFEFLFFIILFLLSINHPNALKTVRDLQLKDQEKDVLTRGLDY